MAMDLSMTGMAWNGRPYLLRIIRNLLKQIVFENIDDASDGSAALNKMRGKKYGLVISDWNMEPMTGLGRRQCLGRPQYGHSGAGSRGY